MSLTLRPSAVPVLKGAQHRQTAGRLFLTLTVSYRPSRWVSVEVVLLELSSHHSDHYKNGWRSDESEKRKNSKNQKASSGAAITNAVRKPHAKWLA